MKKQLIYVGLTVVMSGTLFSCKKAALPEESLNGLSQEELSMVKAAGFNSSWAEKSGSDGYLIEGDIFLTKAQLQAMSNVAPTHNFIVANEEHYRTTNLVSTGTTRTVSVSLGSGFPAHYSTGLNQAIARYNSFSATLKFVRVASGGEIVISGANLGRAAGGGCILGRAAGFPTGGNPSSGFTLSTTKCATQYLNTADKADEVIAHEMGHCIGFRHTDYMNRISCGQNSNEGDSGVGAIHISGTITNITSGNYNSWMMACTNNSAVFSAEDKLAYETVY
jgi:hypothetical protein